MSDGRCDQCGKFGGIAMTAVTGRRLCDDCVRAFQGAAASMIMGGDTADLTARFVATTGWLGVFCAALRYIAR